MSIIFLLSAVSLWMFGLMFFRCGIYLGFFLLLSWSYVFNGWLLLRIRPSLNIMVSYFAACGLACLEGMKKLCVSSTRASSFKACFQNL